MVCSDIELLGVNSDSVTAIGVNEKSLANRLINLSIPILNQWPSGEACLLLLRPAV